MNEYHLPKTFKPVVEYSGEPKFTKDFGDNNVAELDMVYNHPRLGDYKMVITSVVLKYDATTGEIETRNTVYKQRKE